MLDIKAAIFDLDGVIVDTAKYHYLAWKELTDTLGFEFTEMDNERLKGVSRMKSLEILLEIGGLDFDEKTKTEMAERKNQRYVAYVTRISPSEILPGATEFITNIKNNGIKTALASASRNATLILERLNIASLFDAVVDGTCVTKAKPDPDVFLEAAGRLNIGPDRCVVFEDAVAGIEAALRAGMYAVGVGSEDILKEAGQTIKGFDDAHIDKVYKLFDIKRGIVNFLSSDKWLISQENYNPDLNLKYETLFALSNGYMGVRGSYEEGVRNEYPGSYIAGIYDKSDAQVRELVNVQNCLGLRIYVGDSFLNLDNYEILEYKRILDMKKGILVRSMKLRDNMGRTTLVEGYRFLSRNNIHRSSIKLFITPLNYSQKISVESILDGTSINGKESPALKVKHFKIVDMSNMGNKGCYLETATKDDNTHISTGSALRVYDRRTKNNLITKRKIIYFGEQIIEYCEFEADNGVTIELDKYVVAYTSRDSGKTSLNCLVEKELDAFTFEGIDLEFEKHAKVWNEQWRISDIIIEGDDEADKALRFNLFHLMRSLNKNDPMVSIAAKALHGEGYKGHVFWDTEIFMLPFFTHTFPKAARTLLLYRYNMLLAAKENAGLNGYKGAQYPWESADTGKEETPSWGKDYIGNTVRICTGDLEYHITADIAFAFYEYYRATDDIEFMLDYGVEIFLETARFWNSRCEYNKESDRYEINCVIGPDEFHEHIDNNCYTNYLARWNIRKALELINIIRLEYPRRYAGITTKAYITKEELESWEKTAEKIYIPFNIQNKLIEQFDGYFKKKDCLIEEYDENNMPKWTKGIDITRLNDTQLVKQADVVMLLLLLGVEFDQETKKVNYDYYEKRTMHKSSLSPGMYAIMGLKTGDTSKAYSYFMRTANVDLADNQGNTWQGIHSASSGGIWQVAVFGFGGMYIDCDGMLCFKPWLPSHWKRLKFRVLWKESLLEVNIYQNVTDIKIVEGIVEFITVKVNDKIIKLHR